MISLTSWKTWGWNKAMVAHAFNPHAEKAEVGRSLSSRLAYTVRSCLRKMLGGGERREALRNPMVEGSGGALL